MVRENTAAAKASRKKWREKNKERQKLIHAAYVEKNQAKRKALTASWYARNSESVKAKQKAYSLANPVVGQVKSRKRAAALKRASVSWANRFFISEIYDLARVRTATTGTAWHVDHIIPISSKLVCGLHWEANLQVVPSKVNQAKSNVVWPDKP